MNKLTVRAEAQAQQVGRGECSMRMITMKSSEKSQVTSSRLSLSYVPSPLSLFHSTDRFELLTPPPSPRQIDEFTHPKTNRQSRCYRLNYRHMDRSLSNEEVNALQEEVQKRVVEEMGIEMR